MTTTDVELYIRDLEMQVVSHRKLEDIIRIFHKYCDPSKMTYDEHLIWEKWNKKFCLEDSDRLEKSGLKEEDRRNECEGQTA